MDTSIIIRFITSSRGLNLDIKMFVKVFFVLPLMLLLILFNGEMHGDMLKGFSIFISLLILVTDICYLFYFGKKAFLKYKLFIRPIIVFNIVFPLFYICCIEFYANFGLRKFLLCYLLPSFVLAVVVVFVNILVSLGKIHVKSKASVSFFCGTLGGVTFLISREMNEVMSATLSENVHFLVIEVSMLVLNSFMFWITFSDILRYYYYTKLEKAGLVTEDILKPEE